MSTEILDDFQREPIDNRKQLVRIAAVFFGAVLVLFVMELASKQTTSGWFVLRLGDNDWYLNGLILMSVLIMISVLVPTYLNNIKPEIEITRVGILTGLVSFFVMSAFALLLYMVFNTATSYTTFSLSAMISLSFYSFLIANIRIHRLRRKGILLPILMALGIWILVGLFIDQAW